MSAPKADSGLQQIDNARTVSAGCVASGQIFAVSFVIASCVALVSMAGAYLLHESCPASKFGFFNYLTGNYLSPQNCKVEFEWKDYCVVGSTVSFVVHVS